MVQSSFLAKEHGIETIAAASLFPLCEPIPYQSTEPGLCSTKGNHHRPHLSQRPKGSWLRRVITSCS